MAVNTLIQLRRGTASAWSSGNPTLAAGEIGYETDTGLFKIGQGTLAWNSLGYSALPPTGLNTAPYFGSGVYNLALTEGSGISLAYNTGTGKTTVSLSDPTIQSTDITDFVDAVNDRVSNLITAGSGIGLTYTDNNNNTSTLQIRVTGVALSGHTHTLSNITDVTATSTEVNYLSGVVLGSGVASRVVVLDSNKDFQGIRNLTIAGDLTVNGQTTTVNSVTTTLDDPIITLGGDTAPTGTDPKDRGVEFKYFDGTAKVGFFGWDNSTGKFTFLTSATNSSEVFSGTTGTIDANIEWNSVLNKPDPVVTVNLTGEVTGSGSATLTDLGNGTINISTTVASNTVTLGTDTIGQYASTVSVAGTGLSATPANADDGTAYTITSNATPANVTGTIVSRDSSGDFSARNITATQFLGGGSGLTDLNASNISTGTLSSGLLPNLTATTGTTGPASTFVSAITTDSKGRVTSVNNTTHTLATTSTVGIASFDSGDFSVSTGAVSIKTSGVGNSQLENDRITIGQTPLVLGSGYSAISGTSAVNPVILTYFAIDGGTP